MNRTRVLVIGSGIQGVCSALALANSGCDVVVLEQDAAPYNRTSICGEGKIHLGFVYANDPTFETQRLMLDGALTFSSSIEKLIGRAVRWDEMRSTRFQYLVLSDSMIEPEILFNRYAQLNSDYEQLIKRCASLNYVGVRPDCLWHPAKPSTLVAQEQIAGCVQTEEVSIYPDALKTLLLGALDEHPSIRLICGTKVEAVRRTSTGFAVETRGHPQQADIVVNCSWSDRLRIDGDILPPPDHPCTFRLKYSARVRRPRTLESLPSYTLVLGPFGDVVTMQGTDETYLSWYPECLQGFQVGTAPPSNWDAVCSGAIDPQQKEAIFKSTLKAFDKLIPGMNKAELLKLQAGTIVASGSTDISDFQSQLHRRSDIGIEEHDGYFSVNAGKLTTAPSLALQLIDRIA